MAESARVLVVGPDAAARARAVSAVADGTGLQAVGVTPTEARDRLADAACVVATPVPGEYDGGDVLTDVREWTDVPVVVLVDEEPAPADALAAGATDVVRRERDWEPLLAARVERVVASARRERELDRYRTVVESMHESARLVDADGQRTFVDERTAEMMGADREQLVGGGPETYTGTGHLDEDAVARYEDRLAAVLSGESDEEHVELEWWRGDRTVTSETRLTPVRENGAVDGAVAVTRDVSERKRLEDRLRENERQLAAVVENTSDPIFIKNEAGEYVFANEATAALFGQTVEELVGKTDVDLFGEADAAEIRADDERVMSTGQPLRTEGERDFDGEWRAFQTNKFPYTDEEGTVRGVVGIARDVTERKRRERALRELSAVTARSDMSFEEKVERVIDIGRERVGLEAGFLAVVDPAADRDRAGFRVVVDDGNDEQFADRSEAPLSETYCRKTIEQDDPLAVTDAEAEGWAGDPAYEKYGLGCYLGTTVTVEGELYGTLCFTDREPREEPFTEADRDFVELLSAWLRYELERRERESTLRQLLERINGLIHDTVEILVEAATREEINERVCARLVAVDDYDLAWIGDAGLDGERLTPETWAGTTTTEMGDLSLPLADDADDPTVRAVLTQDPQLRDFETAPDASVPSHGHRAAIAVPLTYKDAQYGVLAVYTDDPDAFDEREVVVLSALGRAMANAYNAIETGRILGTDRVIELAVTLRDESLLPARLAAGADCELTYAGSVYQPDGSLRLFFDARDADPETVVSVAREDEAVREASSLADGDDDVLLEVVVEDALVATLADYGAVTRSLETEDGQVRVTVELPGEADAREVYEMLADRYAGTNLVGYHEHDRPVETRKEFRAALEERLTDRQRTAIRTAFLSGFFDWPRPVSGDELAESMDISRPTFHQHLRAAERKLLEELFDPEQ